MNKTKRDKVVDSIFLVALAVIVTGLVVNIYIGKHGTKEVLEPTCEPTKEPTTEETIEYITEPTQEVTEATELMTTLYDVPLDASLQEHIIEEADRHGIDPAIVIAMAFKESGYNEKSIGDDGNSYGLLQVQPKWHYDRMQKLGCTDLLDPYQNVTVGVDYLAEQIGRYGDLAKGLTAYNRGHYNGTVSDYAIVVMALAEELVVL